MTVKHPKKAIVGAVKSKELGLSVDVYFGADKRFHAFFPNQDAKSPRKWSAASYADMERDLTTFFKGLRSVDWTPEIVIQFLTPFGEPPYSIDWPHPHAGLNVNRQWRGVFTSPEVAEAGGIGRVPYLQDSPEETSKRGLDMDVWTWVRWHPPWVGLTLPYSDALWDSLQKADAELRRVHKFLATVQEMGKTEAGRALIVEQFVGRQIGLNPDGDQKP